MAPALVLISIPIWYISSYATFSIYTSQYIQTLISRGKHYSVMADCCP